MPALQTIAEQFPQFALVGVNLGEDEATVREFVENNHITFPILMAAP